jgi:hypothetical protein
MHSRVMLWIRSAFTPAIYESATHNGLTSCFVALRLGMIVLSAISLQRSRGKKSFMPPIDITY